MAEPVTVWPVRVTQTWEAEGCALVIAATAELAMAAARRSVELDVMDADADAVSAFASQPLSQLPSEEQLKNSNPWLLEVKPGRNPGETTVSELELEQFLSRIPPEQLEAARLARIEAGNGHLPLPLPSSTGTAAG